MILSLGVMYYYLVTFEIDQLARLSDRLTIGAIIAFPLLMSGWLTRISPLASPVAAATIVLTIYFRMRCAVVISVLLNLLVAPMTGNDPLFVVTSTGDCDRRGDLVGKICQPQPLCDLDCGHGAERWMGRPRV